MPATKDPRIPLRRASDEHLIIEYSRGCVIARDHLAERYMPMARRLASRHRFSATENADLEQVAYIGLLKAIDRFEADLGGFTPFAIHTIRGELKRHLRDRGWAIRPPRTLQERCLRVSATQDDLAATLGRSPTVREVAQQIELTIEQVSEAMEANLGLTSLSLDGPTTGDDLDERTLNDVLGHEDANFELAELWADAAPAVANMPERQRIMLYLRMVRGLNQAEIAERFGISQMHVSRLIRRSVQDLLATSQPR